MSLRARVRRLWDRSHFLDGRDYQLAVSASVEMSFHGISLDEAHRLQAMFRQELKLIVCR